MPNLSRLIALILLGLTTLSAHAQKGDLFLQNQLGGGFGGQEPVTASAEFKLLPDSRRGLLQVKAEIGAGWHIFSMTQPPGGPMKTVFTVGESDDYSVTNFKAVTEPESHMDTLAFNMMVEEHHDEAIWTAPIEIADGVDIESLKIEVKFKGQACQDEGSCVPFTKPLKASFKGYDDSLELPAAKPELKLNLYKPDPVHVTLTGKIEQADGSGDTIEPGDKLNLSITATPLDGYHVYAYGTLDQPRDYEETLVSFTDTNGWDIRGPKLSAEPKKKEEGNFTYFEHYKPITWTFEITVPKSAKEDQTVAVAGGIRIQTCKKTCDRPTDVGFSATIPVGTGAAVALEFDKAAGGSVKKAVESGDFATPMNGVKATGAKDRKSEEAESTEPVSYTEEEIAAMARLYDPQEPVRYVNYSEMEKYPIGSGKTSSSKDMSFLAAAGFIFLGGMILNLMPCVFPVLGIKVMGFVKQAGDEPGKIRMHGLAFALGLLVSMWILAAALLVVKLSLGQSVQWGAQLSNPYFIGFMIILLFVLGLNMAGIFEVGTSLTAVGGKVTQKKGYGSSFFSGVLTTLVATPCSGPFLGASMTYTFAQPPAWAMVLFTCFGLGIAFPYVLLSFFPSMIQRLPKPGPWMDTFKVTMAFLLFAAAAFFMRAFGAMTGVDGISMMLMAMVVIAMAAYFYGTWGEPHIKAFKRYGFGYAMPAVIAAIGFWMVYEGASEKAIASEGNKEIGGLVWTAWNPGIVPYSLANDKQIIWVDYTADWCTTCKVNEARVASSSELKARLRDLNVKLIQVDFTNQPEHIAIDMDRADRSSVPINLIYPPNYPKEPAIMMPELFSPSDVDKVLDRMKKIQDSIPSDT